MAYKRRRIIKRRPRRFRKSGPRKFIRRGLRPTNFIRYLRRITGTRYTVPTTSNGLSVNKAFRLNEVDDYQELVNQFDMFRIRKIIVYMRMVSNPDGQLMPNTTVANQMPLYPDYYVTVDHTDASGLNTLAAMNAFSKVKRGILRPNSYVKYSLYPTSAGLPYTAPGDAVGYSITRNSQWLECGTAYQTPYYGLRALIDYGQLLGGANVSQAQYFEFSYTFVLEFKNVR